MSDNFSEYTAEQITEWLSQGDDMPTAPDPLYVTLYDDGGSELDGDLENGRVSTDAGTDWDEPDATSFENANDIDFGEATTDITVQEVAIKDADDTDGNSNVLVRGDIQDAPQDFSDGTQVLFEAGDFDFDVLD
ncbi:MAG: hypothetical protein ACLFSD_00105 [Salinivenus sp.]